MRDDLDDAKKGIVSIRPLHIANMEARNKATPPIADIRRRRPGEGNKALLGVDRFSLVRGFQGCDEPWLWRDGEASPRKNMAV